MRFLTITLLIILLMLTSCTTSIGKRTVSPTIITPMVHVKAPNFEAPTLTGDTFQLAKEQKGRVVVINFWASWCAPCIKELPSLETLWNTYKDKGLLAIGVSINKSNILEVKKAAENIHITYPIVVDKSSIIRKAYEISSIPYSYFIGKDGRIYGKLMGEADWQSQEIRQFIKNLLNESSKK